MSLETALLTIYDDVEVIKEGNKITYTCPYEIIFTVDHVENTITAHNFDNIIASDGGDKDGYDNAGQSLPEKEYIWESNLPF